MVLTDELKRAVRQSPDAPIELVDPETKEAYFLVRSTLFNKLRHLVFDETQTFVEGSYRLSMESFRDGWDDPAMDVYNALDPRNSP